MALRATYSDGLGSRSSTDVPFPSGSQAGDRCFIMFLHEYGSVDPSGWETIWAPVESGNVYCTLRTKVLDSSDISTGHLTVTSGSAGTVGFVAATWEGDINWRKPFGALVSSGGNNSDTNMSAHPNIKAGDTVLIFGQSRTWNDDTITAPATATQLEFHPDSDGKSSCLYSYEPSTDGPFTVTHHMLWGTSNFTVALALTEDDPAPAGGHRYWRIRNQASNSYQVGLGEIEMATEVGGFNLCVGGTPFASGSYGGTYSATTAFNGNLFDQWYQNGGQGKNGAYIGYDFGDGVEVDIAELRICPGSDPSGQPWIFDVEYSDDGSSWTWAWTGFNTVWSAGTFVSFAKPIEQATNQHWGIDFRQSQAGNGEWIVQNCEFRTVIGGSTATGSGTPLAYPLDSGSYSAANAFDGTSSDYFNSRTGHCAYLTYDFGDGNDLAIQQVALEADSSFNGNNTRQISEGYVVYSQDGLSWARAYEFTGLTWSANEVKTFIIPLIGPAPLRPAGQRFIIVT